MCRSFTPARPNAQNMPVSTTKNRLRAIAPPIRCMSSMMGYLPTPSLFFTNDHAEYGVTVGGGAAWVEQGRFGSGGVQRSRRGKDARSASRRHCGATLNAEAGRPRASDHPIRVDQQQIEQEVGQHLRTKARELAGRPLRCMRGGAKIDHPRGQAPPRQRLSAHASSRSTRGRRHIETLIRVGQYAVH